MNARILVAYASKYGATAEIAEKIGQVLTSANLRADVRPIEDIATLSGYDAVILGSAVYIGQWRKDAAKFLELNEGTLAHLPVWLFSTGPTGEGEPVDLMKGWHFPENLQPIADRIHVRDTALFHGVLDKTKLNFGERMIIKGVKAPIGDYRDWDAIITWAQKIADAIKNDILELQ